VVTEQVFLIPGFGKLIVDSVFARDFPVVEGVVLVSAAAYVFVNLMADLIYALVDPRVRASGMPN
jgi:peptide/nickel transport system permease protein